MSQVQLPQTKCGAPLGAEVYYALVSSGFTYLTGPSPLIVTKHPDAKHLDGSISQQD